MSSLYLTKVRISNFRTYGKNFEFELPNTPGLTILCGMNGLGKTGFFDAMEWALTSKVERLGASDSDRILTRDGSDEPHGVDLSWGDLRITRGLGEDTSGADIVNLLKSPTWNPKINEIGAYLKLTHLLPQSDTESFLKYGENKQWELLKGPAGVDQVEDIRRLLKGQKLRNNFNAKIREVEQKKDQLMIKKQQWETMLEEFDRLNELATMKAACDPNQLEAELVEICKEIEVAHGIQLQLVDDFNPAIKIQYIRDHIEEKKNQILKQVSQHPVALELLEQFNSGSVRKAELQQRAERIQLNHHALNKALEKKQETLRKAEEIHQKYRKDFESKKRDSALLLSLIDAWGTIDTTTSQLEELKKQLIVAENDLNSINKKQQIQTQSLEKFKNLKQSEDQLFSDLKSVEEKQIAFNEARKEIEEARQSKQQNVILTEKKIKLTNTKQKAEINILLNDGKLRGLKDKLNSEQKNGDAINKAVSIIAENLNEEDNLCPVCLHKHPEGELTRAIHQALEQTNVASSETMNSIKLNQNIQSELKESIQLTTAELIEIDNQLKAIEQKVIRANQLCQPFHLDVSSPIEAFSEHSKYLNKQLEEKEAKLSSTSQLLTQMKPAEDLEAEKLALEEQRSQKTRQSESIRKSIDEKNAIRENAKATLATNKSLSIDNIETLKDKREKLLTQIAEVSSLLNNSEKDKNDLLNEVKSTLQDIEQNHLELSQNEKSKEASIEQINQSKKTLLKLGYAGEPSTALLDKFLNSLKSQVGSIESFIDRLKSIGDAFALWSEQKQLLVLKKRIQEMLNADKTANIQAYTLGLDAKIADSEKEIDLIQKTMERVDTTANQLTELSREFGENALNPLSEKITQFLRIISPFDYRYNIEPRITSARSKVNTSIDFPCVHNNSTVTRDIDTWLSEGQKSILGLGVLFGASTVYKWSKWRALLLDDPLQHTDLIHVSAFADVIRGLIRDESYQIMLSTHSIREADFLERKCEASGIPVRRITLTGLGPEGVRYRVS
ncbi:MAG: AAA family ATPase [Opitutaceae bacterium]